MRYPIDHDFHIHTHLSICSGDPEQTPENILQIAKARGLKTICITDHYWDDAVPCHTKYNRWYAKQNFAHISEALPLPKDPEVRILFGCEVDMDSSYRIGIPPERWKEFDFILVSTTHFHHMTGEEWENCDENGLAELWVKRFEAFLSADLPFGKVGIAHLACSLICRDSREAYLRVLDRISDEDMQRVFTKAAALGVGIELNYGDILCKEEEAARIFRMFRIAKEAGCKFYLGSDAHERKELENLSSAFERAIDVLELKEEDKFVLRSCESDKGADRTI